MPFISSAISAANLIKIRGDATTANSYQNTIYLSASANTTVYSARVNQTSFPKPGVKLTYDGGSGTLADVRVDMTILVSRTNDKAAAFFRGRIRSAPSSTIFYVNETGDDFQDDDYIFVIDDYDIHQKLARYEGQLLTDWDQVFSGLGPLISGHQAGYADFVDSGTSVYEISFAPTVDAAQNGETISTYLWDVDDGTITVGTTATKDITVTFPAGQRWVHLTATDSAGNVTTRHIIVFAHTKAAPPAEFPTPGDVTIRCEIPLEVNNGASEGWSAQVAAFDGVDSMLNRTLVVMWNDEKYNGTAAHIENNIAMIGRFRSETSSTAFRATGQIDASTAFDIEGALAQLGRIAGPSIQMDNSTAASTLSLNIDTLTVWRGIWAILSTFSTFGSIFPLSFGDTSDDFEIPSLVSQGSDLLGDIADIAQGFTGVIQMAPDGRCEVVRRTNMLLDADRSSAVTIADMITSDTIEGLTFPLDYIKAIARITSDGGGYNSAAATTSAFRAIAPPGAPDEPASEDNLPRQFLIADQSTSVEESEMVQRAGDAFAAQNNLEILSVTLLDGWNFLIPSVDQRYTWTLPAALNTRGITYDTTTDWMLQSIEKGASIANGTYAVTGTFVRETNGADGAIVPFPIVDTGEFGFIGEFEEIAELTPITFDDLDFDFSVDDGGFEQTPDETAAGTYAPATGWQADCVGSAEWLDITKNLGGTKTVTSVTIAYDATYAGGATSFNRLYYRSFSGGIWQGIDTGFTTSSGTGVSVTIPVPNIPMTDLRLVLYAGGTDCTGSLTLTDFSYTTLIESGAWNHTFDFTVDQHGFLAYDAADGDGVRAIYSSGNGWGSSSNVNVDHLVQIQLNSTFTSTQITSVTLSATIAPGVSYQFRSPDVGGAQFTSSFPSLSPTQAVNTNCTSLWFSLDDDASNIYAGYLSGVTIRGTGVNPFI